MTERGLPSVEGAPACPFVAFEDDRDERADRPDHRHRCYAEVQPAPRALAHQEAYCLSSAFPVCPTFQDWARRESARARAAGEAEAGPGRGAATSGAATAAAAGYAASTARPDEAGADSADEWRGSNLAPDGPVESTPRRNPPRDWAAPPPWATGMGAAGARAIDDDDEAIDFRGRRGQEGLGLAGSPADRLASGGSLNITPPSVRDAEAGAPAPTSGVGGGSGAGDSTGVAGAAGAGAVGAAGAAGAAGATGARAGAGGAVPSVAAVASAGAAAAALGNAAFDPDPELAELVSGRGMPSPSSVPPDKRPPVSSTRAIDPVRDRERERDRAAAAERAAGPPGPSWERARRFEAYPTIKTRAGVPGLPRVAVLAGALAIATVAVFFLPAFLGIGGGGPSASPSPRASAVATATPSPTPEPAPTPQNYTIKEGDTLSKVAKRFKITLAQLLAANTETIEDPDKISIGDVILIPAPDSDEITDGEASAAP